MSLQRCPKLITHAAELYGRKVKLTEELELRLKEEKFCTFVVDEAPASHHGIEPNTFARKIALSQIWRQTHDLFQKGRYVLSEKNAKGVLTRQ
jgi:hypothetical protein